MAIQKITRYIDDLDGSSINEGEVQIVQFSVDGDDYALDLTPAHAAEVRSVFQKYIDKAHPAESSRKRRSSKRNDPAFNRKVRAWAIQQGYKVSSRGRLAADIIYAYNDANGL